MNNGKPNEDEKGNSPPRVPLLEDVFTRGEPTGKPVGKNGSRNHSLAPRREPEPEPEPEPMSASDDAADESAEPEPSSQPAPTTAGHSAADESAETGPSSKPAGDDAAASDEVREEIGKGVKLDPYIREWLLENAKSMSGMDTKGIDQQAVLRAGAELMVDNLVKEYSREIVKRLRKELTSLLHELDNDKEKPDKD